MAKIKVYHEQSGKLTVRIPKGTFPDRATIKRLSDTLKEQRKAPAQSGHSEQGMLNHLQEDSTTETVSRQEFMQILEQLPVEDVEEITQRMRDMIKGRA